MNSVATLTELTLAERRELLKMARARDLVGDRSELPPIERALREGPLPLSFAQERLWFIDRLEPGSAVYNISVAWRLAGALDEAALERALGEIVRRHEALRTVFAEVDGSPVQVIAPFGGFALPVEDLYGLGEADREAAVVRRAGEEASRPFDLSVGPLFRAALLRLGAEEHVLLLSVHHIVSDGLSMGLLYRELSVLYEAYHEGRTSPLPELAVQYADYALWQREHLRDGVLEGKLAYWRERLADAPALLELPTDHPRPPVQTFRGAHERMELSLELLERLQALGRSEGATLYMTLLAAFQVLLSKYSGSDDIVVGSPIAGRMRKELEETIGFFVNTVVLRTDLSGDPSFREVLGRAREVTLGAYEHQDVPFEKLVAELEPERSLSHTPLFQVMFAQQNAVERGVALPGLEVSEAAGELESAKFDLFLTAKATPQGLRVGLNYSTDLFERGTVQRMLSHLARVLEQAAADGDVRLSEMELLGPAERALVLEEWNRTEAEYPADRCIHELFQVQAARTPTAVAVRFEDESLTYRELNEGANRLAHHLRRRGVGPEVRVGICLERSLEMVVGILAILKAGGAYVPLDPAYPADRLAFILADSATPVLLTRETLRRALPALEGVEVVSLDGAAEEIAAEPAENPQSGAGPESLAYVIYTSGSTGAPKGALIEHRNVARLFTATDTWFGFGADDVWTLFHSYAFDFSVWELWGALLYGGRVVVVPHLVSRDPEAFHALVQREGVTVLSQTPSAFRQFIRVDGERGGDLALRVVVFGGEALEPASLREWVERRGAETPRLVNMYGITETTVHVTYRLLTEADVFGGAGSPIGVRIPDLQLYVCDSALRPLPVGVPGELYVGGGGVARGYLNRPELTAQRFVENPFGAGKLYRTGDRVRWLADGTLDYLGRLDEQVKIRGFRIELGEIEAALRQAPGVRDCTVIVREDETGDRRLVAYVVGEAEAEAMRDRLRQSLPEYMVPAAFVPLDALPLTANGKLDRKALPAPEGDAYARRSYEAPLGEVEAALAEIWGEVLGVERVGRWDQFFELGGHSLLAIKLIGRMRRAGLHTDVRALFTTPVLAELALAVGGASSDVKVPANEIPEGAGSVTPEMLPLVELSQSDIDRIVAQVPGGAANVQDIYPLAPLQEGFLFHYLLSEEGDPYLTSSVTEFDTRARLEQYLAALQAVIDRHDILRTAVAWEGLREPVQVVLRHAPLPVEEVELDAEAEDAAGQLWRRYDARHFRMDLRRAPLLRVCIAEDRARGRWLLLMLKHHLTGDHESLEVLREEISAHLLGLESELPAPLPFRNYVAQARLGVSREEHERFFRGMLGDVEEPTAPYGLLDVWGEGHGIGEARLSVAGDLGVRLRRRARALGVSAASLCHLAWAQVLARLSGRQDVVFGTLLFGRMQGGEGVDRVMGPFINTLPVRIGVGEEGVEAAVRRTHALLADLLRHEHASLALAQRSSGVAAPAPLFTSLLNYRHGGGTKRSQQAGPPDGVRGIRAEERTNYPVVLSVDDRGEAFSLTAQVAAPAEAERVCWMMHTALEGLVEALEVAPRRAIGSIDVLPEAERALVLEAWNRTAAEVPANLCIHELFEEQAARTPEAVAVRFEEESLTYAELNAHANRLAHHLRGRGVGPEVRVGVLMERSLEMVVSLLAVLKAGGAYVPLDPGLPAERLAYMLDDSAVPLVLVQVALRGTVPAREGVEVLAVDALAERLAAEPAENPAVGAGPDSLAYVIYTSGSTGRPKGVMNQHRGVVNRLVWMQAHFGIGADDVVLQKTPFGFDVSVWEFFWPLQQGATLVMARPEGHRDPAYLRDVIEREGVTTLHFVPSMLQPFVETVEAGRYGSLRHVVCSGEALPAALVRRFYDRFGGPVVLTNLYGPTEAAVDVSCWTCPRDGADGVVPIGRPVWNTTLYVLDAGLRPVPVGTPGELYIGGVQVARGYQGRAAMTAERFVPDPFSMQGGARLYRTGDRARWRADGAIEYLGRLDFQVKVRGFRIELGEIEGALRRSEGVADCVVVAREDVAGERRLVAYVVGGAEAGALREHLLRELPEYMVPAAFVVLEALPLTPNGKLDRKALPAPEGDAYARRSYEAPLGEVEAALAGIWAEVLGLERVGRWDQFFELGGHSLLAIRLIERMRRAGLHTDVRALFTTPVLAELALTVGGASQEVEVPANGIPEGCGSITPEMLPLVELSQAEIDRIVAEVPGGAANVQDIYPLAPLQEGILFHYLLSQEGDPYLTSNVTEFDTRARLEQYLAALQAVIDRHDILRTSVAWEGLPEPVQVVLRHAPLPVEEVQLDAEAEDAAGQLWRRFDPRQYRMDLTRAPLRRACIAEDRVRGRWLLLMLTHHLTNDHESLEVLREEIWAHLRGLESELPAPLPFRNYVAQARLGVSREEHERFFRGLLGDVEEPTAPYGLLDVWGDGQGIGEARLAVAGDLGARLRRRARALGVSAASLCHLAWAQVLARLSGRADVVFGTLLFGRMQGGEGADRVMGPFINTLPVRIGVGEEEVETAVRRTHALLADLLRHEHASLSLAQRSSGVAAPAPLFTSLLNYRYGGGTKRSQQAGQPREGIRGVGGQERTNYPVTVSVDDMGEAFSLTAQVAAPADAERVCRMMHTALEGLVEALELSPGRAIGSIDVLPEAERALVLEEWNRTDAEYPADRCIHELFEAQAERTPDAVAVVFEEAALTYATLDHAANRLANHLWRRGVRAETRVGICLERGPELVVAVLAVLKAGGAYVPLDPAYPAERLAFMLADSGTPLLLTRLPLPEGLTLQRVEVVCLDGDRERIEAESAQAPVAGVLPETLAYVIYTSGSTGRPKGVLVQHGSLSNLLAAAREAFGVREGDVMPALASYAFDIWLFEALLPLISGGAVRLVERERVLDVAALLEEIADATLVHAVPALMRELVQAERHRPRLARLRCAFVGGDRVPADLLAEMREALSGAESHVLYGPTEGTILASTHPVPADGIVEGHPIGRPLGNVRLYVCDALGSPQPVGVAGELLIGGAGVARGYLGRAGLTAEQFVPDPFSAEGGARLYRTGDRARWRTDGTLEYLGRLDFQVKVRGFRIELGEIEAVLRQHESVTDCVVVAREDVAGDRRLVAYAAGVAEAEELREHLRGSLPEYMVPAAFVVLDALPLTPNGKLDRKALPAPEYAAEADRYVAPRTPVEEVMAGIWAEVLRVERVGVHDNFFTLGGHSLLAVTLVERMRRRGVRADVRALFTTPTVAELAAGVEGTGSDVRVPPNLIPAGCEAITPEMLPLVELTQGEIDRIVAGVPGGAENVQDIYPLAPLQEGILFHHLLAQESDPYLLPQPFAFDSREQRDAYLAALQSVVARHDILRTSMVWEGLSEPVQVVWRHAPLSVEEVEVDPAAVDAARQMYERFNPLHQRVDLGRAPLLRAYVGREAVAGRWGLLLLQHHIVSDHTTADVLREELKAHLDGRADQLPAPLPFRNYVAQARLGVSRSEHEAFFSELLGDVDEPTAPFGLREVRGDGLGLEQMTLLVDEELGVRLRERARRLGVSTAAVCHVACAQVLARASGRGDVVFGTVLFGRMQGGEGADRVLGPFINTLPVRIRVAEEGAEASVRRTQALLASLVRHEHAPLALAQQCGGVPAPEPLFSALFNYRHLGGGGGKITAPKPRQGLQIVERSNYPLNLAVNDWGDGFSLSVQVEAEVGAERVCALMHTALAGLVQALEEAPERPLESIEVLPQAERRQVLEAWNRTEAEYPADRCIHELFEAQAARTPDAVAVVFDDDSLTYRKLNERANRLAHHLVRLGVGPEVRVGIYLERSLEMVVSLLAVLKAGGAYVPLDPAYPAERLAFMLADSATSVLLTQQKLRGLLVVEPGVHVVVEEEARAQIAAGSAENVESRVGPRNLAYLIYTSGSTGTPKGVAIEHESAVVMLAWAGGVYSDQELSGVLASTSISFDLSVYEIFLPLVRGGRVVVVENALALPRSAAAGEVRLINSVPSAVAALLKDGAIPSGVKTVNMAGEPLRAELVDALYAHGIERVYDLYGPSEDTTYSTFTLRRAGGPASIGTPIANTQAYVLDAGLRPLPVGVPGELYLGGRGVTRGYLGRPGLTAQRYVPDPFSTRPGARMYRTGDRIRWKADGTLEYLGRLDHQVKVRGFRIELGEIEAVLRRHAGVADCVVMARAEAGEQRLVAYVVGGVEAEALRADVRRSLPEYMLPSAFVFLDALPLTPNGKLDRKALPAPEYAAGADRYVAPRTPVEEVLAGIWAEVLRLERVGVEESFFELGGHSLLATRVVSRIRDVFAIELPLRALFEAPTVAELAGRVEEMRRAELPVLPPLVPVERTGALPLSFAQERLWFIDRLEPGSTTYNIPAALRLTGALDERALERSLGEIVRRHEALRTVFDEVDGSPVQVIAPFSGFTLPVEDLSASGDADREAAVRRRAGEEARRAFDLSAGPLFRAALLRLGEEDHVLLLSMHHVVSDGWSMGVLFRELSALYAAYREGGESPLPELAVQYADYAVWQREQLAGEVLDRQLAYWKESLADAPALLELPTDHPRPAVQTYRGAAVPVELSPELLERLQRLGRSEGATLYMTLLGAFQVLLSKYSASDDIVVGSPIAGRTRREVEELIGFFVNTLVLRTDLSEDPSFRETMRRVRETTLGAYEHQEVPFEKLVAELQPERSLSHAPLFQVMFTLQNERRGAALPGLEVSGAGAAMEIARFDLSLELAATSQGLRGGLNYSTDLFERGTIVRMLGHLERVLEQVAEDADVRLSQMELLSEAERALVLEEWNRTAAEVPADRCVHELFEAQVERTPDAVAVEFEEETLTYAELNARANRLAHHLRALGVGPDARVGVCVERGPEMVACLLAILKAGGAYVPLDPAYPADRLRYMLEDSAPAALVTQSSLAGTFAGLDVPVVELDAPAPAWAQGPETNPACAGLTPDHLAYVIYTSGSTGRPKGVMVEHRSLVNHTAWQAAAFGIGARDTVLQRTSISFDASVWEMWTPLATGARMLLLSSDAMKDPAVIGRAIEEGGATIAQFVPTLLQAVLGARPADSSLPLRTLFCGGEPLSAALVEEARSAGAGEVVNLYGPTEATIDSTWHVCGLDGRAPAIGRPIANARIYVLGASGAPAPVGVVGELYVGGAGVARGYLGRAGLTAERFVPDPFSVEGGARMYRTGDLGRWRADGTLEFLGRTDFQVKVRGFRIELGEIEAALLEHEDVRECAVLMRADAGETRVVAYVVGDVETDALRSHVRRILPDYMVPGAFVALDRLPLTPNGKLDRKALPAPEYAADADRYVAPRTPVEEVLAGIWAEVLRLERVGVTESFFELGGHSLLATRVVSRIREVLGVEVPLRALFEGPTVAELAGRVEEVRHAELPVVPPVVPVERTEPLPLSFAQERLWILHQMEPEGAGYNMSWPSLLRGCLDAGALERALGELVRRHEALRTTFRPVEQGAVQIIHPAAPAHLPVLDLTGLAPQDREREARRLAREDAERPFDLQRGPLLRATLVRLSDEEHVLLLTMHHIVSDGWSMGVLFGELFTLYELLSGASGAAPLPPLAVQYADFAVWQRGWLTGEVLRQQLDWWRERLGGAPPALELPTDRPRPAVASSRGGSHVFRIPAETTRGLRSLARREGATLYMATHAALDLLLARWSGQEDLVVGSPIAGRTQMGTEGLIGFFVNTLALRIDLSGDPSFQELVRRVRETALGAYAHQDLPFERLVEEVAPDRGLSHTPLFQVMFALQNAGSGAGPAIAGLRREPFGGEIRTVRFDLELDLREVDEELVGSLRFRTDLFDAATMERFAAQYGVVLAAAAASPEERLSLLAVLPPEEERTLLAYGSGPVREDGSGVPVHRLFAAQAARTPEAPAVLFAGESLTYAELDAQAGRLALELRSRGVSAGTTVAVCLERGPGVLVALLGVWKAGGVYLPLDPKHPAERLSLLLGDSGAALVVTEPALAGVLPEREVEVVLLDGIPTQEGAEEGGAATAEVLPGDLAYLIYTSGSTGTPKAVMVEHAQLTHTLSASLETLGFAPGDVVAALASTAFDISLLELVTPLLAGGAVWIVPHEMVRDPETLVEVAKDVTVLHAVPALMRHVVEVVRNGGALPSLRLLLVGGDMVPPDLLADMRALLPAAETRVLYGPTEATIICATYAVPAEGAVAGHPLGRPLPGVHLAVRGPRGEMVPVGVPGEVWISGGGVARGYLGRPELNADKFVGAGAARAYRTGDRARWCADGVLEFLGRTDGQVKVRGFRIEPGEVEAVLREQPGIREAVVLAREDAPGDRRLVAYVVPGADGIETAGAGKEQVSEWETLFDDTYAQDGGEEDPTLQLKGWNSSYTGEPIPREEMRAWVEHTADRILALRPERVLEVGCGTGLVLFRVAPHTRSYHGTDFSAVALRHVRRHAAGLPQVSLSEREADRLDDYAGAGFDLVVVNSVAQYFPDLDYLLRVLQGAAAALRPGGRIFVGDVRSLPLAEAFHASVELARAPEDLSIDGLQARVRRGMAEEQELLLDPALFEALRARIPRLGRVEAQVKRGEYDNEVSRFRYDVVLHLDVAAAAAAPVVREWSGEDAAALRALAAQTGLALLVHGVPDARVREHVRALELISTARGAATAGEVRALADAGTREGESPEALFALGEEMGRAVEVRPGAAGTLNVLFHPPADVAHFPAAVDAERPWESYANDPQWGRRMRALVPALREAARARLPEYMVPSAFVVLEALPVTANGKVNRGALPAPDTFGLRGGAYVTPRTPAEERMAGIWAQVLGVERVGVEDHFFEMGGHSLLATQLVSRVREAFGTELPLRAVFEAPTLAELAVRVEVLRAKTRGDAGAPPLVPVPRDGAPLPLSFAQQRLWFIDQLEPGSTAYNMPSVQRLRGPLDPRALERALGEMVRRHEALRTTFEASAGVPFQVVHPAGGARLEFIDLSLLAAGEREAEARRLAREEAQRPFDLRAGPLFHTRLLRLGQDDHVLVLAMHHVVSDGWSMGVLHRELGALYEAFARGEPSPLPELPVQYADFAVWQRAWLAGEALERQIAWWRDRLEGAPPVLELPTDRARPAMQGSRAGRVFRALPPQTVQGVRALARREGATLYMVLLAALDLLLARWSGQEDVVVGTAIANRTRRETEGLIGFFVNTLALRTDLSGNPSFQALLGRVRETTLEAYQHQDVPFERLVEELRVERSLSHAPLFQVMFSLIDGGARGTRPWGGLAVEPYGVGGGAAKFDLDVMVVEQEGGLGVGFTYREELWDASTLQRVAGAYALLLQAVAADPGRPVLALPLVSEAERESLLAGSSGPLRDYPAGLCVHHLFAAQAGRTPRAPALVHAGKVLDYAELERAANRLANHLRRLGAGPETRVGISLQRGPELVVAMLAILKAGGAYVPLDPAYPRERLGYMLEDTGVTLVITDSALADRLPESAAALLLLDVERDAIAAESDAAPESGTVPENLSHVIFTSGSTGRPKAVMIRHSSVVVLLHWMRENVTDEERSSVLFSTSINFDVSVAEVFGTLAWGGKLVIAENALDLATLDEEVVHVSMVPSAAAELLKSGGIPACVKTLNLGGEALPNALAQGLYALGTVEKVGNLYGPTEDTTYSTYHLVPRGADQVLVGRPVANTQAYVLDDHLHPVPIDVVGELYLAGDGLSRGYASHPAMTAERFVPCPFGAPGARMYRVMDRVRRRPDGELEYLGRTDFQVKVRGYRMELGEIEARLLEHADVREVVVTVREDVPGDRRLVAYYLAGAPVAVDALKSHLADRLPGYMVPAAYVWMEALPMTPNGKVDRKALPAPEPVSGEASYVAPRRPLEATLAGIWAEVLGRARVGVKENFFDLGGHSLLLVEVQARLRKALDRKIPIVDLFRFTTVAALAEHLGADVEGAGRQEAAAEGRRRRGRDRAAVRRALAGQSEGTTLKGDDT